MDKNLLSDLDVTLRVELGSTTLSLRELRNLGKLVELDQSAGDPVVVKVGDKVIAYGELVTVDDQYGVRITEMNPE